MSFAEKAVRMAVVTFVGVTSGVYIFTPIVDNIKQQVRGCVRGSTKGGPTGGVCMDRPTLTVSFARGRSPTSAQVPALARVQ